MAKPQTKTELLEYCLRALGAPVIKIDVAQEQLDDRFEEALQFWQEYHSDAVVNTLFKHKVTAADISNGYITVPDSLLSVTRIFSTRNRDAAGMFSVKYQMYANDLWAGGVSGGLVGYELSRQYLNMVDLITNGMFQRLNFSRHQNRIHLTDDTDDFITEGMWLVLEGFTTIEPDTYPDVYNDMALKRYLTALIKFQWGSNLSKFEGMQMPGGITFNGRQIMDDAREEIRTMEETFQDKYEEPPGFFIG